jgi:hypothetical protein
MRRSPNGTAIFTWHASGWVILGMFALIIGLVWCWIAVRELQLWVYADRYVDAELEVRRFHPKPTNSQARCQIEGVIHPGGETVVVTDEYLSIKHHDGPDDRWGREPTPGEIEGRRLPVSHWPQRAASRRWWYPPTVVSRGQIPGAGALLRDFLGSVICLAAGWFCFRRARAKIQPVDAPPLKKD